MPLVWGSQAQNGNLAFGSQESAGVPVLGITQITGTFAAGASITIEHQNAAGVITQVLIGGVDVTANITANVAGSVTLTIPTDIALQRGAAYQVDIEDGTNPTASASGYTLQPQAGWSAFIAAGLGALDDADTESLSELGVNQNSFTMLDGDQVLIQDTANTSWNANTTPVIDPPQTVSGSFAVLRPSNSTYYGPWPFTIAEPDSTPNAFGFTDQTDVARSATIQSNTITPDGYNQPTSISISGGEYSINAGAFTASAGTIEPGDVVAVRVSSSANYSAATSTTLTVGGVSDTFTVTTLDAPADTTPDAFSFTDQNNVEPSTVYESNTFVVGGIDSASPITISGAGAEYSIDGGSWTNAAGTVTNGQSVQVRTTSSALFSTAVNATLTIGGVSDVFSLTTRAGDTVPDAFVFADVTGADLSTEYTSNAVVLSGFLDAAPISVTGAEYSIDGGSFTTTPGTVNPGASVRLRLTSSGSNSTATNGTLNVGGVSDTYTVATRSIQDTTPDAFSFPAAIDVAGDAVITSANVVISGIDAPATVTVSAGGEYSINGGAWTSTAGTISNGQQIRVRQTSSASELTLTTVTLTIGGVAADFEVTTADFFDAGDLTAISAELSVFPNIEWINSGEVCIYENNATEIRLNTVTSDDGELLDALDVSAQVKTLGGTDIGSAITLNAINGTPGNYEGDFIPSGLSNNNRYLLVVTLSSGGTDIAEFNTEFLFKRRGHI